MSDKKGVEFEIWRSEKLQWSESIKVLKEVCERRGYMGALVARRLNSVEKPKQIWRIVGNF